MTDPLFVWSPPRKRTDGDLAAEFVAPMKLNDRNYVMDVHQRAVLDDIYAEGDVPDLPVCFSVTTVGPRQATGKSGALIAASLYDMFVLEVDRHVWSAHLWRTVKGTYREAGALINSVPDVRALCKWPPLTGNGQAEISMLARPGALLAPRIEYFTRGIGGGGRGEVGPRLTVDEALFLTDDDVDATFPTMATIDGSQIRLASSAGLGHSAVLRRYRDRGRAGAADPAKGELRSAYREFGVPRTPCATESCEHLDLEDPGCVLNDRGLWRRYIPMDRMPEWKLADFRKEMSPAGFAREFYSWWDEPDDALHPIDADAWKRAGIDALSPDAAVVLDPVAISVACSQDRSMSTVGVAGERPDGKAQVELAKRARGHSWVVEWVRKRNEVRRPVAVVVNPASPAGFLAEKLRKAGVEVWETTAREFAQGCDDFRTTVNESKVTDPETGEVRTSELVHTQDVVLTSAVHAVETKPNGGWDPDNEKTDVSALTAATLAFMGLRRNAGAQNVFIQTRQTQSTLVVGPLAEQWAAANAPDATTAEHMPAWERDRFRKLHAARVVVVLDDYTDFRPSKYGKEELVTMGG